MIHNIAKRQTRPLRAAEAALLRWYPGTPLALIDRLRLHRPNWPVIHGGKPQQVGP